MGGSWTLVTLSERLAMWVHAAKKGKASFGLVLLLLSLVFPHCCCSIPVTTTALLQIDSLRDTDRAQFALLNKHNHEIDGVKSMEFFRFTIALRSPDTKAYPCETFEWKI